tara:strand:+ start:1448 stop:1960 length:513 start_codon:yes stop_codon:yes gene_type:complete
MPRSDIDRHLARVDKLVDEVQKFAPEGARGSEEFRSDLAGLIVVAIAAAYEACVKEVLVNYASERHPDFQAFVNNQFEKLSSRVNVSDLNTYAKRFNPQIHSNFKERLKQRRDRLEGRVGVNIQTRYEQILSWRHEFAHAGIKNTTIQEATEFHKYAKRVLYCFDEAFTE